MTDLKAAIEQAQVRLAAAKQQLRRMHKDGHAAKGQRARAFVNVNSGECLVVFTSSRRKRNPFFDPLGWVEVSSLK
jgi:hypothetical protein